MTLTEAREAFAAALTGALPTYTVTARPAGSTRPGTGWVLLGDITPGQFFGSGTAALVGVLVLSPNEQQAEAEFEALALPALQAVRDLPAFGVTVAPETYFTGPASAALYVATVTLSMEVQQ